MRVSKIDQVKMRVSKIDQLKGYVWKSDQLLHLYIAVSWSFFLLFFLTFTLTSSIFETGKGPSTWSFFFSVEGSIFSNQWFDFCWIWNNILFLKCWVQIGYCIEWMDSLPLGGLTATPDLYSSSSDLQSLFLRIVLALKDINSITTQAPTKHLLLLSAPRILCAPSATNKQKPTLGRYNTRSATTKPT